MNAIIAAKRDLAREWVGELSIPDDWRRSRIEAARDWLLANGGPHRRDHFWSYTDPALFLGAAPLMVGAGEAGKGKPNLADRFSANIDKSAHSISPLADHETPLFGRLIAKAHQNGARPMAEKCLLRAKGEVIKVNGDAGLLVLDRANWSKDHYIGISLEPGAQLSLIEIGEGPSHLNALIEAELGEGAALDHIRVSTSPGDIAIETCFVDIAAGARFSSFSLSTAAPFRRFESIINLSGPEASANIAGADLLLGPALQDHSVFITHDAPNCESRQVFKRVVGGDEPSGKGAAKSVFQGKILVNAQAQKTDGYQISQGLFLGAGAGLNKGGDINTGTGLNTGGEVLTKPELEIYADDVACSHGSTSSGLDQDALFYFRARGIGEEEATGFLIRAFLDEAIEEIDAPDLREEVARIVEAEIFGAKNSGRDDLDIDP